MELVLIASLIACFRWLAGYVHKTAFENKLMYTRNRRITMYKICGGLILLSAQLAVLFLLLTVKVIYK